MGSENFQQRCAVVAKIIRVRLNEQDLFIEMYPESSESMRRTVLGQSSGRSIHVGICL